MNRDSDLTQVILETFLRGKEITYTRLELH